MVNDLQPRSIDEIYREIRRVLDKQGLYDEMTHEPVMDYAKVSAMEESVFRGLFGPQGHAGLTEQSQRGGEKESPEFKVWKDLVSIKSRMQGQLGLQPTTRKNAAKIPSKDVDSESDKWDGIA